MADDKQEACPIDRQDGDRYINRRCSIYAERMVADKLEVCSLDRQGGG